MSVCHWTMARTSLAISKICSQDIRVTIRFSDRPRQFRLIGYQLDESRALRRRTNYDGFLSFARVWFSHSPSFPWPFVLVHERWQCRSRPNFHSTNTNDGNRPFTTGIYSFYRFRRVVRVERRTDGLPISTIAYLRWITMRSIPTHDCL